MYSCLCLWSRISRYSTAHSREGQELMLPVFLNHLLPYFSERISLNLDLTGSSSLASQSAPEIHLTDGLPNIQVQEGISFLCLLHGVGDQNSCVHSFAEYITNWVISPVHELILTCGPFLTSPLRLLSKSWKTWDWNLEAVWMEQKTQKS